jgi:hypothetical protein
VDPGHESKRGRATQNGSEGYEADAEDTTHVLVTISVDRVIRVEARSFRCGTSPIAGSAGLDHGAAMPPEPPVRRPAARHRAGLFALLVMLAMLPAACDQPRVLSTVSCPVYQPPQTPQPEWPKQCGGTR